MDLRQLRSLVALAEEGHFTRAAARMHIAQPALSQQIRRLEDELGLALVDRTTRRVALTDAGILLVARARRALGEIDAARAELADLAGVRAGHLVIGAMQSLGPFDLSRLLAEFHGRHPAVELTVLEEVSDALLAMVRSDQVDLAFASLTEGGGQEGMATQRLVTEPLVVLLAPDHRLAGRGRLRIAELRDERFISFREGAGLRRILDAAALEAGFEPQIAFETNEVQRAQALASRGLGVTIVPESDGDRQGPPVVAVALHRPAITRDVTLVWREARRHTPAARAFLQLARGADRTGAPASGG
ncbi:LysR family transcriptional regulator [Baekduia soli]|uniref:LysR family transcriptional regulator n=1 Tax=Baekduia soli TaxID=496014 RepID=A0A5B8U308_9ACTN|nr:LysR substrate-binding domain-containing protein [Baekduia soli]QEC47363.1 LysR family transcriptional regulator [Baekduia soli]